MWWIVLWLIAWVISGAPVNQGWLIALGVCCLIDVLDLAHTRSRR